MKDKERRQRTYLCSFCGKNQDQVRRLIAGPKGVYVCDECVARFSTDDSTHNQQPLQNAEKCSFCGLPQKKVQYLVQGPGGVSICSECIALCLEIIATESRLQ